MSRTHVRSTPRRLRFDDQGLGPAALPAWLPQAWRAHSPASEELEPGPHRVLWGALAAGPMCGSSEASSSQGWGPHEWGHGLREAGTQTREE